VRRNTHIKYAEYMKATSLPSGFTVAKSEEAIYVL
jgi:hypothetical protein